MQPRWRGWNWGRFGIISIAILIFGLVWWRGADPDLPTKRIIVKLQQPWDDAIGGYDKNNNFFFLSEFAGELILGDAANHYGISGTRTYFRFKLPEIINSRNIHRARIQFSCSYGGSDHPAMGIHYIDRESVPPLSSLTPKMFFEPEKNPLPLSRSMTQWSDYNSNWTTGKTYSSPDIGNLLREYAYMCRHGYSREIVLTIHCLDPTPTRRSSGFKGIVSFDSDPVRAAQLIVDVYE